jgi:hypothetical protein
MCNELIRDKGILEPGMRNAIEKYRRMMVAAVPNYNDSEALGGYVNYILNQGSIFEKTRLVRNLDVKLTLRDKRLIIG